MRPRRAPTTCGLTRSSAPICSAGSSPAARPTLPGWCGELPGGQTSPNPLLRQAQLGGARFGAVDAQGELDELAVPLRRHARLRQREARLQGEPAVGGARALLEPPEPVGAHL